MKKIVLPIVGLILLAVLSGCVAPMDYTALRNRRPRSILVPPPLNDSTEPLATYSWLSTVTAPLAEQGYYVFPVAVVDRFFKENGLPSSYEMHQAPLNKIDEIFGADAVLYTRVKQYGTKYMLINSTTVVEVDAKLVDVKTGTTLWEGHTLNQMSSGDSGGGVIGMLVSAAVTQIINTSTDQAHQLCPQANAELLCTQNRGLLFGPYHPQYQSEQIP
ncbi:MAG TPA: GNA1162 family protein [Tichowtungia sp.]|nr:GNA1162 family protein [Tichowtungia sp.]